VIGEHGRERVTREREHGEHRGCIGSQPSYSTADDLPHAVGHGDERWVELALLISRHTKHLTDEERIATCAVAKHFGKVLVRP